MNLIKILLNQISHDLRTKILVFIRSLKPSPPVYADEWDEFAVKTLYVIFDIED